MPFQLKYYYSFKDSNNQQYTVNILEDSTDTLIPIEIEGAATPFTITYPELTNKFDTVRGSGANLNVISVTDRQFLDLYTANMLKYRVTVYKGASLIWTGYLDSELYSEPFSELNNYFVNLKTNDGFNLLDRLNYVQSNGEKYYEFQTQWQVLTNIFSKLSLNYNAVYVALSTSIDGVTLGANETIFHQTYVNTANYINEDGQAETCRTVLEATLKPYGAFIQQINGSLYISDFNIIASEVPVTFKKYNSSFVYIENETINPNIGDLSEIGFANNVSQLDTINGINKQVVSYSHYIDSYPVKFKPDEISFSSELSNSIIGTTGYKWKETLFNTSNLWNKYGNGHFVKAESIEGKTEGETNYYMSISRYPFAENHTEGNLSFKTKVNVGHIINSNYYLRVNVSAIFRTKSDWKNSNEVGKKITQGMLRMLLKVGNQKKQYVDVAETWYPEANNVSYELHFFQPEKLEKNTGTGVGNYTVYLQDIADRELTCNKLRIWNTTTFEEQPVLIPLNDAIMAGGYLEIGFYDFKCSNSTINYDNRLYDPAYYTSAATADCIEVQLTNIELSITDKNGNLIDDTDTEYLATLNPLYKNEGDKITTIHGTAVKKVPTERGGLFGYKNSKHYFFQSWTKENVSDKIERLLLRSVVSNYTYPSLNISGTINSPNTLFGYLTYNNYLAGKKLMVTGATIDFEKAETSCSLTEFNKDNLTII